MATLPRSELHQSSWVVGLSGVESGRSCNGPSLTIAVRQLCNVATSRCCWGVTAPGPHNGITSPPYPTHSGPRPAYRESEARGNPMPIRIGHQKLVPESVPAVRGQPPVAQQRKELNADFGDRHRPWKTKPPAHVLGATHKFLTWQRLFGGNMLETGAMACIEIQSIPCERLRS